MAYFISYATIKNKCGADLKQFCIVLRPQNNKIQTVILFLSPFFGVGDLNRVFRVVDLNRVFGVGDLDRVLTQHLFVRITMHNFPRKQNYPKNFIPTANTPKTPNNSLWDHVIGLKTRLTPEHNLIKNPYLLLRSLKPHLYITLLFVINYLLELTSVCYLSLV